VTLTPCQREEVRRLQAGLAGVDGAYVKRQIDAVRAEVHLTPTQLVEKYQKRVADLDAVLGLAKQKASRHIDEHCQEQLEKQRAEDQARVELYVRCGGRNNKALKTLRQDAILRAWQFAGGRIEGRITRDSPLVQVFIWASNWIFSDAPELEQIRKVISRYRREHGKRTLFVDDPRILGGKS
jgi:hypothetical protein